MCVCVRETKLSPTRVCVFVTLGVTLVDLVCGLERGKKVDFLFSVPPWSSVKKK